MADAPPPKPPGRPEVKQIRVERPAGFEILPLAPAPPPPPPVEVTGPIAALRWGLASAWTCRRAILIVLIANLALAALAIYPLLGPMDGSLSRHPEAARIGRHLDVRWWTDWTVAQAPLVSESLGLLGAAAFLSVLAGTFFAGGLLEALRWGPRPGILFEPLPDPHYKGATPEWRAAAPGPASAQIFLRESARHFPRFLVYLILSLPLYWAAQQILNVYAVRWLAALLEHVEDERVGLLLTAGRAAIFALAFQAVTVFFEYVRATEVLRPGTPPASLLAMPLRLLRSRPGTVLGIEAGALLLQVLLMLAFVPLDRLLGRSPIVAVTLGLLASQTFLLARLVIRSGAQAAQLRLVQAQLERNA